MDTLYIDNSTLSSTAHCDFKVWTRYQQHLTTPEERAELLSGKAGHAALASFFTGWSSGKAILVFDAQYREWAEANVSHDDRLSWPNVRAILFNWMIAHPKASLPYSIVENQVEVSFEVPLDENGDIIFIGRIDAVISAYGALHPMENKFTGNVSNYWAAQWALASQGSGYCYALRWGKVNGQVLGVMTNDFYVNAIQLSRPPSDPRKTCKTHRLKYSECGAMHPIEASEFLGPFARPEPMLHKWRKNALRLAHLFMKLREEYPDLEMSASVPVPGWFTGHCRFCEFHLCCTVGGTPEALRGSLVKSVWDPRTREEVR